MAAGVVTAIFLLVSLLVKSGFFESEDDDDDVSGRHGAQVSHLALIGIQALADGVFIWQVLAIPSVGPGASGGNRDAARALCMAAGVVMMLVGNVMPLTTGMNSLDPHIPWLTMSRESWMRLRRLCGWTVFIYGLLALAVSSLLSDFRAMTACTMVLFLLPTIVACVYGTKLARASRLHPRVLRVIRL